MMDPNFFILGAPKCGTTALADYLRDHPRVFFPLFKEPHFFNRDMNHPERPDPPGYRALFAGADPSRHLAVGEGSTNYLFSEEAVPGILRAHPGARFIVMLRDPVELVRAWHGQMLFLGMENLVDFEEAWAAEADRSAGKRIPFGCPEPKKLLYSRWGRLGDQVERLLARTDPARTKILFFDDFAARTAGAYREVLDFLGLPDDGRTDFPVVNQASKVRWFPLHRASHVLSRGLVRAKRALGIGRAGFGILERFRRLTAHRGQRGALRPEFKATLRAHFREDIQKLSRLTGRDLSAWLAP